MKESVENIIRNKVQSKFAPDYLELVNESHMHSVPENSETHFKLTLVSRAFEGLMSVKRHQQIYGLLADEIKMGVHALALHLHTPEEWQQKGKVSPNSPVCMGGSKKD